MPPIFFDDVREGDAYTSARRTITDADIAGFAGLSGDFNPLHVDDVFAREQTPFGRRIAHGLLGVAIGSGLRSPMDDLHVLAFLEVRRQFVAPIFPGDTVHVSCTVTRARRSKSNTERGVVTIEVQLVNQDGTVLQTGTDTLLVGTDTASESKETSP